MMSALAMILTAAMAIPGNGPEMEPWEIIEQGLDLRGEWVAILYWEGEVYRGEASIDERSREFVVSCQKGKIRRNFNFAKVVDEGNGCLRLGRMGRCLGIYQQDGDHVRLCLGDSERRPTSFRHRDSDCLLILHRIKRRK